MASPTRSANLSTAGAISWALAGALQWLFTFAHDRVVAAKASEPPVDANLFWQVLDVLHVGPAILVFLVGVVLVIWGQIEARNAARTLEKKENQLRQEDIEAFVRYLYRRLLWSEPCSRVSLFEPTEDGKFLRQVYRTDGLPSRRLWSIDPEDEDKPSGIAGLTYTTRIVFNVEDLPDCEDWENAAEADREKFCRETFTPSDLAGSLSWRARAYRSLPVPGPNQEPIAVLMFESKEPRGLAGQRLGSQDARREDGNYLSQLLYSRREAR